MTVPSDDTPLAGVPSADEAATPCSCRVPPNELEGWFEGPRTRTRLRARRTELQLAAGKVAKRCGLYNNHYSRIERGFSAPGVLLAMRISDVLQASVEELWQPPVGGTEA